MYSRDIGVVCGLGTPISRLSGLRIFRRTDQDWYSFFLYLTIKKMDYT